MQTLIKTVFAERGELYAIKNGNRILVSRCEPKLEFYEYSQKINVLGSRSYEVKTRKVVLVICLLPETTREINAEYLQSVSRFEVKTDIQRADGIFERLYLDNLMPNEIDLQGDWIFEVLGSIEPIKKYL